MKYIFQFLLGLFFSLSAVAEPGTLVSQASVAPVCNYSALSIPPRGGRGFFRPRDPVARDLLQQLLSEVGTADERSGAIRKILSPHVASMTSNAFAELTDFYMNHRNARVEDLMEFAQISRSVPLWPREVQELEARALRRFGTVGEVREAFLSPWGVTGWKYMNGELALEGRAKSIWDSLQSRKTSGRGRVTELQKVFEMWPDVTAEEARGVLAKLFLEAEAQDFNYYSHSGARPEWKPADAVERTVREISSVPFESLDLIYIYQALSSMPEGLYGRPGIIMDVSRRVDWGRRRETLLDAFVNVQKDTAPTISANPLRLEGPKPPVVSGDPGLVAELTGKVESLEAKQLELQQQIEELRGLAQALGVEPGGDLRRELALLRGFADVVRKVDQEMGPTKP